MNKLMEELLDPTGGELVTAGVTKLIVVCSDKLRQP